MANPNIVNVTTINANNSFANLSTTSATLIVNNPASSNKVYKVNVLSVSNVDGTTPYDVTINIYDQDDLGGTAYPFVSTLNVPADSAVAVVDKNTSLYLKEDQSIGATAGTENKIFVVASWEEIS